MSDEVQQACIENMQGFGVTIGFKRHEFSTLFPKLNLVAIGKLHPSFVASPGSCAGAMPSK
jgi:hypothetical protein